MNITIGKPIPVKTEYREHLTPMAFWRASDRGGHKYISSNDANGQSIIIPHTTETEDGFKRRKRISTLNNYVSPIISRYNSFVFSVLPTRPEGSVVYDSWIKTVNGHGQTMDDFMSNILRRAQIDGSSFILVDTSVPFFETIETQAQAEELGMQVILRDIKYEQVPYWTEIDGDITSALIILHINGFYYGWEVNEEAQRIIGFDEPGTDSFDVDNFRVMEVSDWMPHGYGGCPLVRIKPTEHDSQAAPIAENQKEIFNLKSLLHEELYSNVFTQWVVTGASVKDLEILEKSTHRVICCTKQNVNWQSLGSDKNQADSIRESIKDSIDELYRTAGVTGGAGQLEAAANVSGIAHAFLHLEANARFAALATICEDVENKITMLWAKGSGVPYPGDVTYNKDYTPHNIEKDLDNLIKVTNADLPKALKRNTIINYVKENMSLTDDEMAAINEELETPTVVDNGEEMEV